jgi:hypothetical protein
MRHASSNARTRRENGGDLSPKGSMNSLIDADAI